MNKSAKSTASSEATKPTKSRAAASPKDLQPQATGANRGSPAAPVMKQFAKTKAESTGRS